MLEGKILGIFTGEDYLCFSIAELSKRSNTKTKEIKEVVDILLKKKKIVAVNKKKYQLAE